MSESKFELFLRWVREHLKNRLNKYENFIHNKFGWCYYAMAPGENPIIYNLYVHKEYRRQGHGKWLLQYVIREIRQSGCEVEIMIEARPKENSIDREKLILFYTKMGLTIINSEERKGLNE